MKAQKKKVMKVAAFHQALANKGGMGADAFRTKMPFDEEKMLRDNVDYIAKMLGLAQIDIVNDDSGANDAEPGQPRFHCYNAAAVASAAAAAAAPPAAP